MINVSSITTKGQVVIPAWLRKKLGLKPGTKVSFSQQGNDILIHPQTAEYISSMAGMWGEGDEEVKYLLKERKKDTKREEVKIRRALRSR